MDVINEKCYVCSTCRDEKPTTSFIGCQSCDKQMCFSCTIEYYSFVCYRTDLNLNPSLIELLGSVVSAFFMGRKTVIKCPFCNAIKDSFVPNKTTLSVSPLNQHHLVSYSQKNKRPLQIVFQGAKDQIVANNNTMSTITQLKRKQTVSQNSIVIENIKQLGTLIDVPGDGSCGYHAMIVILLNMKKLAIKPKMTDFRKMVRDHLFQNMELFTGTSISSSVDDVVYPPWIDACSKRNRPERIAITTKRLTRICDDIWEEGVNFNGKILMEKHRRRWMDVSNVLPVIVHMYKIPMLVYYSIKNNSTGWYFYEEANNGKSFVRYGDNNGIFPLIPYHTTTTTTNNNMCMVIFEDNYHFQVLEIRPPFAGIKNLGNTCWLAASLQLLFSSPKFVANCYKRSQEIRHDNNTSNHVNRVLTTALMEVAVGVGILAVTKNNHSTTLPIAVNPQSLKKHIDVLEDSFDG